MIKINTTGLDATAAKLRGLSDSKIKTAMVSAINQGAYAGKMAAENEIKSVFDRPTPWIQKSPRYWKATKAKPEARIDLDFWGNKQGVSSEDVLRAEITGGQRKLKRFERALAAVGVLPQGMMIRPGPEAKMDAYGNMQAGQIVQILSFFRAFGEQGYKANMTDKGHAKLGRDNKRTGAKGFQYFAIQKRWGRLGPGIYQRFVHTIPSEVTGKPITVSSVKKVMHFIKPPSYQQRIKFYEVAGKAAREQVDKSFPEFLDQMLKERGL